MRSDGASVRDQPVRFPAQPTVIFETNGETAPWAPWDATVQIPAKPPEIAGHCQVDSPRLERVPPHPRVRRADGAHGNNTSHHAF